ncbi:MAG: ABC transporter permease subunit [Gaiellaceae bacterium]
MTSASATVRPARRAWTPRATAPHWLRVLMANRKSRVGVILLGLLVAVSAAAPLITEHHPEVALEARAQPPSLHYPFGTTYDGFNVFSQVIWGGRVTLLTAAGATLIGMLIAASLGILAGTFGGWVDELVSVLTNTFLVIPVLPLVIMVAAIIPRHQHTILMTMLMVGLSNWAPQARVLRAQAVSLRNRDFIAAAETVGEARWRISFSELMPNMASRIAAGLFFIAIQSVIIQALLDYLATVSRGRFALGDTSHTTWGSILAQAQNNMALLAGQWWHFLFPSLALLLTATALVLSMYGIEELADPRLRIRRRHRGLRQLLVAAAAARPRPLEALHRLGSRARTGFARLHRPARAEVVTIGGDREPESQLAAELGRERPSRLLIGLAGPARFLLRRVSLYALVFWIAVTLCYLMPRLLPRATRFRAAPLGPFWRGYRHFLAQVLTGHLDQGVPGLGSILWNSLPFSLFLVGVATILAFLLGSAIGMVAAWRRGGAFDSVVTTTTAVLWATPSFVLAGLAVYYIALELKLFPIQWAYDRELSPAWSWSFLSSAIRHAELPILVLITSSLGLWVLSMRNVMIGLANEEYIDLARAKGISESRIMRRYAGRNAMLPVLTGFGVWFSFVIGGIPAVEMIFSYPGGGWELQQSVLSNNFPLLQGLFLAITISVVVVNLIVDLLQLLLDPRLRSAT